MEEGRKLLDRLSFSQLFWMRRKPKTCSKCSKSLVSLTRFSFWQGEMSEKDIMDSLGFLTSNMLDFLLLSWTTFSWGQEDIFHNS